MLPSNYEGEHLAHGSCGYESLVGSWLRVDVLWSRSAGTRWTAESKFCTLISLGALAVNQRGAVLLVLGLCVETNGEVTVSAA